MEHILVSAGAGTGKTRVLTLRYAHLVTQEGLSPHQMLAVTFTNKAAYEMKHRLKELIPETNLWIGTFHSLGLRLLREHAHHVERTPQLTVLDPNDQHHVIQKLLKERAKTASHTPRTVLDAISAWKNRLCKPEEVVHPPIPLYRELYAAYEDHLALMNSLDFDDLLCVSLRLMRERPEILKAYGFSHVLVDEYQDVNEVQDQWLKGFVDQGSFLFCVGDEDQSIYEWRGASVHKILAFPKRFTPSQVIMLEDNYRSTPSILAAATHLIGHNKERYGKVLKPSCPPGEKVLVCGFKDSTEEARCVVERILTYGHKEPLSSMAILVRTRAQTREFEEQLTFHRVPYALIGNAPFYERLEVRDLLAYLRVIHSPSDNCAFERMVNVPRRGVGPSTLQALYTLSRTQRIPLEQAAILYTQTQSHAALSSLLVDLQTWRRHAGHLAPSALAEIVLSDSGYKAFWQNQGLQGEMRLENLRELIQAMASFETLAAFLEHVTLLADVGNVAEKESVALMTLYTAKGLEFPTVFLPGWEENLFPHIRSLEEGRLEEERRLAYVGLTRAKKRSLISFCWQRKTHHGFKASLPSRFIRELPEESLAFSSASPPSHASPVSSSFVFHGTFGRGVVQSRSGPMVSVMFERYGLKKVLAHFLNFLSK